jgi:exosortase B
MVGLAVLYGPTFYELFTGIWAESEQMHGPVILGISIWLLGRNWAAMELASVSTSNSHLTAVLAWSLLVISLALYAIGRAMGIRSFEVGSLIGVVAALLLLHRGSAGLKVQWFPLFFMLFMVPLPATLVDVVTQPMKMAVSYVAENILYWVGYPISRNGVILQIGQYMLLVADACAGLHTLLTLEAMGLLYLNIIRRDSAARNIALAILVIPISFSANVIRVMTLTLVTYHFGDAAGQGFLHGFAGMVLFMSALLLIIALDTAVQSFETRLKAIRTGVVSP